MLFNSFVFLFLFLPVTYSVFWLLRSAQARYVWLTITGYVFYGYWDYRFCFLMAFSTLVSYSAGLVMLRAADRRVRKAALVIPIVCDLLLLAFFKYANFAIESTHSVATLFGYQPQLPHLNIILPVGISFYTFHTITYIVDSYRGVIRPTRNVFEFAAYVSLFSQLVAGPIVRFRQIEEDLERIADTRRTEWMAKGVSIFVCGLIEKVVLADALASFVDPALEHYALLSSAGVWLVMCAYSLQLYFDFCGYSDMAVGLGLMFGIRIPWNFNSPYKALNPSDLWQRWHISLSSCLRDYLYIPLGGNRLGSRKTERNLMLTMLLGGLWHGANWTFVLWGAYHGGLLIVYRRTAAKWDGLPPVVAQWVTFLLVVIGWVFFRSLHMSMAADLLQRMFVPTPGTLVPNVGGLVCALTAASWWAMAGPSVRELHESWNWRPSRGVLLAAAFGMALAVIAGGGASPFLYFQF